MINSRHRRFYSKREDKKKLPKMQIKSGMIIEFMYRDRNGNPSRPLPGSPSAASVGWIQRRAMWLPSGVEEL